MTELEKYELVNSCKSIEHLALAIEKMADNNGFIQGMDKLHDAKNMAYACRNLHSVFNMNALTRNYGIRQQAYMLRAQNNE